jgi:MFS family permease
MGTAAFVALLMTLCNKSFSATQFALLSALSAVGRVYVGPIAGWFVEAHGWPTFYLFSVAAVPGIALLLLCRQTLEHTRASFMPRSEYPQAYALALGSWRWAACCWRYGWSADPQRAGLHVSSCPACWRLPRSPPSAVFCSAAARLPGAA